MKFRCIVNRYAGALVMGHHMQRPLRSSGDYSSMTKTSGALITALNKIASHPDDSVLIAEMIRALDETHQLAAKIAGEPGLMQIMQQFVGRIVSAYGSLARVKGQRILDIACGSSTSKFPASIYVNSPL